MTVQIDGTGIGEIVEIASLVGTIVAVLALCLIVYLMVRPPRHVREARRAARGARTRIEAEPVEAEDVRRIVDRMDARLEVLERALADQVDRPAIGRRGHDEGQSILTPVEDDRDSGRTK